MSRLDSALLHSLLVTFIIFDLFPMMGVSRVQNSQLEVGLVVKYGLPLFHRSKLMVHLGSHV